MAKDNQGIGHSVVFRGAQPMCSIVSNDDAHDEKVSRAVNDAHALNQREGASAEISVQEQDKDGKIAEAPAIKTKGN